MPPSLFRSPSRGASPGAARRTPRAGLFLGSLVLGGLHTFSFAPTPHGGWWQLLLLAAWFALLSQARRQGRSRRQGALAGAAFGFGNYVTGVYWLYISMHHFGGMPAPLAAAALILFSMYLAVYPALGIGLWFAVDRRATRSRLDAGAPPPMVPHATAARTFGAAVASAAVLGAAWTLTEWLRGTVFTGFPWLSAGYAQVDGPLAGFAPVLGVYGVGGVAVFVAALLAQSVMLVAGQQAEHAAVGRWAGIGCWVLIGCVSAAAAGLARWHFTTAAEAPLTVRLLQGNVPQSMKFEQSGLDHSLALYQQMITEKPADLVVTPETALPILINSTPVAFAEATRHFVDRTGTALLLGAAGEIDHSDGTVAYTNSLFGVTPGQRPLYRYDKHHLVPFGEFVPWGFRWFVNLMQIPLGDFARGAPVQTPFIVKGERVAVNICYEDLFGEEIARTLREQPNPAGILVNSTNLAWFGDTIALDQHLEIARMRALETQRPMLRATNTGVTAAIDADGRVQARLANARIGSIEVTVQGMHGLTPYIRFGNAPALWLALGVICAAAGWRRRIANRPLNR